MAYAAEKQFPLEKTIPRDLVSGTTYYLGAIVDYDDALAEIDGYNVAYHIIRVN